MTRRMQSRVLGLKDFLQRLWHVVSLKNARINYRQHHGSQAHDLARRVRRRLQKRRRPDPYHSATPRAERRHRLAHPRSWFRRHAHRARHDAAIWRREYGDKSPEPQLPPLQERCSSDTIIARPLLTPHAGRSGDGPSSGSEASDPSIEARVDATNEATMCPEATV